MCVGVCVGVCMYSCVRVYVCMCMSNCNNYPNPIYIELTERRRFDICYNFIKVPTSIPTMYKWYVGYHLPSTVTIILVLCIPGIMYTVHTVHCTVNSHIYARHYVQWSVYSVKYAMGNDHCSPTSPIYTRYNVWRPSTGHPLLNTY